MKKPLTALFVALFLGPGFVFGGSLAIEHLCSLNEVRVFVRAPVYEPIPGHDRRVLERDIENLVSVVFREGGLAVCEHASAVFRIHIEYVESCDETVLLVRAQLRENAQLIRKWEEENAHVRVITWDKSFLTTASPERVYDELADVSKYLADVFVHEIQGAKAADAAEADGAE
jgi:hypothetical protein